MPHSHLAHTHHKLFLSSEILTSSLSLMNGCKYRWQKNHLYSEMYNTQTRAGGNSECSGQVLHAAKQAC